MNVMCQGGFRLTSCLPGRCYIRSVLKARVLLRYLCTRWLPKGSVCDVGSCSCPRTTRRSSTAAVQRSRWSATAAAIQPERKRPTTARSRWRPARSWWRTTSAERRGALAAAAADSAAAADTATGRPRRRSAARGEIKCVWHVCCIPL